MVDIVLVDMDLSQAPAGTVHRITSAAHNVFWNGHEYLAVGDLLEISGLEETADIASLGVEITLSGVDPAYRAEIDANGFRKAPLDIWAADVPEGTNVVASADYIHRGYCDTPQTQIEYGDDVSSMTIQISTESVFGILDKIPDLLRSSQATHSSRHNGDQFFKFTAATGEIDDEIWRS